MVYVGVIIDLRPNFNGCNEGMVEEVTPHMIMDAITYPCSNPSQIVLVEGTHVPSFTNMIWF